MRQRGRKPKCPYCGGNRTIRKGVRRTVTLGDRALCICRDCERKFTQNRPAAVPAREVTSPSPARVLPDEPETQPSVPA